MPSLSSHRLALCAAGLALLLTAPSAAAKPRQPARAEPQLVTYGEREDVMRFAAEAAERRGLDVASVRSALAQARLIPSITRYIMPPAAGTAKNWIAYRDRFVEPRRIGAGAAFWKANESWLKLAED